MNRKLNLLTPLKYLFMPATKRPTGNILIVLHGKGDSIKPFETFQDETKLYNTDFLLLNAPKPYLDGYSWYGERPYMDKNLEQSRFLVLDIIRQLLESGYTSRNIYILGYSQGCLLGFDVLLQAGIPFGGFIGISGYFQFPERWRKNLKIASISTPLLFTHGRGDRVLPLDETLYGVKKLAQAGFSVKWHELKKKHEFSDDDYPLINAFVK